MSDLRPSFYSVKELSRLMQVCGTLCREVRRTNHLLLRRAKWRTHLFVRLLRVISMRTRTAHRASRWVSVEAVEGATLDVVAAVAEDEDVALRGMPKGKTGIVLLAQIQTGHGALTATSATLLSLLQYL